MSQSQESSPVTGNSTPEVVDPPSTPINPQTPPRTPAPNRPHRQQRKTSRIKPKYGEIPGIEVGDVFSNRSALHCAGVHLPLRAGIHGRQDSGAYSIVLSGRYEDDTDGGEEMLLKLRADDILGGKNENEEQQQTDQHWTPANKSLRVSCHLKSPVRVIRGAHARTRWAPREGYRYDGLYQVDEVSEKIGKGGHKVCVFKLERLPGQRRLGEVSDNPLRTAPEQHSTNGRESNTDNTPRIQRRRRRRRQSSELPEFVQGSSTSTGPRRIRHRSPEDESDYDAEWQSPSKKIKRKHVDNEDAIKQNLSPSPGFIDLSGVDLDSDLDIRGSQSGYVASSPPKSRDTLTTAEDRSVSLEGRGRPVLTADIYSYPVSSSSSARPGYGHVNLRDTNNNVPEETVHISVLKDETDEDSDEEVGEIEHSGRGGSVTSGSIQIKGPFPRENMDDSDIETSSITYLKRESSIEVEGPFPLTGPRNHQEVHVKVERNTMRRESEESNVEFDDDYHGLELDELDE